MAFVRLHLYSRFGPFYCATWLHSLHFILYFIQVIWGCFFHSFLFKCLASQTAPAVTVRSAAICVKRCGAFQKRSHTTRLKPWCVLSENYSRFYPHFSSHLSNMSNSACYKTSKIYFERTVKHLRHHVQSILSYAFWCVTLTDQSSHEIEKQRVQPVLLSTLHS